MNHDRSEGKQIDSLASHIARKSRDGHAVASRDKKMCHLYAVVDVLLVLLAVIAVLWVISLWMPLPFFDTGKGELKTVTYRIELVDADEYPVEELHVGDSITVFGTGTVFGTVSHIAYVDAEAAHASDMEAVSAGIVALTVTAEAEYHAGDGYYIGDVRIAAGVSYELSFAGYFAHGLCTDLKE